MIPMGGQRRGARVFRFFVVAAALLLIYTVSPSVNDVMREIRFRTANAADLHVVWCECPRCPSGWPRRFGPSRPSPDVSDILLAGSIVGCVLSGAVMLALGPPRRYPDGCYQLCGYSHAGIESDVCPECGELVTDGTV